MKRIFSSYTNNTQFFKYISANPYLNQTLFLRPQRCYLIFTTQLFISLIRIYRSLSVFHLSTKCHYWLCTIKKKTLIIVFSFLVCLIIFWWLFPCFICSCNVSYKNKFVIPLNLYSDSLFLFENTISISLTNQLSSLYMTSTKTRMAAESKTK